ncbi:MAG: hypothetical protein ACRENB_00075 [Gemmatimonadales bacterium]
MARLLAALSVTAQGNNWQDPASCDAQLQVGGRRLRANAVLATPAPSGAGQGPRCTGVAYLIRKK